MSLLRRTIQWLGVSVLIYPLALLYSVILARGLGPSARGEYAALLTLATMLAGVLSLALGVVGRAEIARNPSSFRAVHSTLMWFCAFVALIVLVAVLPGVDIARRLINVRSPMLAASAFVAVPLLIYGIYWPLLFQGMGRFREINVLRLGRGVLEPLLLVAMFVALGRSLRSAVVTWLGASLIVVVISLWVSIRLAGPPIAPDWMLLRTHLQHGWKLAVSAQAVAVQTQVAVLLLARYHPGAEVAFFAIASGAAAQMGILAGTLAVVSSDRLAGDDKPRADQLLLILNRLFTGGAVAAGILFVLVGVPLVSLLYGSEFRAAGALLWVLAAAVVGAQATEVNCQFLIGQYRETDLILKMGLANAVVGVGLCALLIPSYGAFGAAVGVGLGYLANAVAYQVVVKSRLGCTWREMTLLARQDVELVVRAAWQARPRVAAG